FTGCLVHLDLTFQVSNLSVQQITGIIRHNEKCLQQDMKRKPAVPLHEHVWQVALQQLNDDATITAIQARNQELSDAQMYAGQKSWNPQTANIRYDFLPSDSTRLYRKFSNLRGIDIAQPPHYNIDNWLNPTSATYKPELAAAIFHYQPRTDKDEHLCVCIQTPKMVDAAWKYAHKKQIILDGTFGVCDRQMLLFIALGVNETGKGVPLAFLLFLAPTGNKATQAGYDTTVLYELLKAWRDSLGTQNSEIFKPTIVITDTDTKERGALILLWPDIILLLCKFHIRQCWTNHRKKVLHIGQTNNFPKQQVQNRLRALEDRLILSVEHAAAQQLITNETQVLHSLKQHPEMVVAANAGLNFLKYLRDTWMPVSLWNGWSQKGRIDASQVLQTSIEGVIPTTNHLEAFNGLLKQKYI
ncbi:hypothetical protein K439DRAFT_1298945, partial [Ramaria rubella]